MSIEGQDHLHTKIKTCFSQKQLSHFLPNFVYKEIKLYKHDAGHTNMMAAMLIYGKNPFEKSIVLM